MDKMIMIEVMIDKKFNFINQGIFNILFAKNLIEMIDLRILILIRIEYFRLLFVLKEQFYKLSKKIKFNGLIFLNLLCECS